MSAAASPAVQEARQARVGYPASSARFDALMAGLSFLFLAGLWVDGWAHFHGKVDDSFFTPWHLVFYSAYAICALVLGRRQMQGIAAGHAFGRALPKGYAPSLVGVVLFGFGGVGDMVWHTLFGIEAGAEALLSPTHILLAFGMFLILSGPLRSAWARAAAGETLAGWRALLPMLVSAALVLTLLTFFTSYAHPLTAPLAHRQISGRGIPFDAEDFGVASIFLQAGLIVGLVGVLMSRWRLPVGAIALILTFNAGLMTILVDSYIFLPALIVALLIAEAVRHFLRPTPQRSAAFVGFLALLPVLIYAAYFVTISTAGGGIKWSIHVWTGAIVIAGVVGGLVGWALAAVRQPE